MKLDEVYYPINTAYSMGRLPNDVRTQIIASDEKEIGFLAKLLLLERVSDGTTHAISRG